MTIRRFRGEYSFLSNFHTLDTPIPFNGIKYPTVEHFYQAMKTKNPELRKEIATHPKKGLKNFQKKNVEIRPDWDEIKLKVMMTGLKWKFHSHFNPKLHKLLLETGDQEIIETNEWHDIYWGVDSFTGFGENHLGRLLMECRNTLRGDNGKDNSRIH